MKLMRSVACLLGLLVLGGCSEPGDFIYGSSFSDAPFVVFDEEVGIHPSKIVLDDPNNPFALSSSGGTTKWEIHNSGNRVAAFYSWATWLVKQPTGEHQYYVAVSLHQIWSHGEAEDLDAVREMAIGAYQSVLDNFPAAVSYDAQGKTFFELVTAAFNGIVELGGTPTGGWTLVQGSDGNLKAVRQ